MTVGELIEALRAFPEDMVCEAFPYGDIMPMPVEDLDTGVLPGCLLIQP